MAVADYKKVRCVWCKYEFATTAKAPRCRCGSRRLEPITDFAVLKPYKGLTESADVAGKKPAQQYNDEPEEQPRPAPRKPAPAEDDRDEIDRDIWD